MGYIGLFQLPHLFGQNLSNDDNELVRWDMIKGLWNITENRLIGGTQNDTNSPWDNIIISPYASNNFSKISTSFSINNLDDNSNNYVAIIYSFKDINNYKFASMHIYKGETSVRFANVDNGTVYSTPAWPYVKTDLKWNNDNTVYEMSLSKNGAIKSIGINGTTLYSIDDRSDDGIGYLGLKYGNIRDIHLMNYELLDMARNNTFVVSDTQNIFLQDKSLPEGSFIHLYDSSPYKIVEGHIDARLPCEDDGSTDLNMLIGMTPYLVPFDIETVSSQSNLEGICQYQFNIQSNETESIADITLQNNSTDTIEFPFSSSILIHIAKISEMN
ncbi:MAG: hypothetical protein L0H55_13560 [Candidatus Nitrosocosmicus sp.]|nr:hypothetical protein [Candidatus Nitrosocosmicus sp.]